MPCWRVVWMAFQIIELIWRVRFFFVDNFDAYPSYYLLFFDCDCVIIIDIF